MLDTEQLERAWNRQAILIQNAATTSDADHVDVPPSAEFMEVNRTAWMADVNAMAAASLAPS